MSEAIEYHHNPFTNGYGAKDHQRVCCMITRGTTKYVQVAFIVLEDGTAALFLH